MIDILALEQQPGIVYVAVLVLIALVVCLAEWGHHS